MPINNVVGPAKPETCCKAIYDVMAYNSQCTACFFAVCVSIATAGCCNVASLPASKKDLDEVRLQCFG